MQDYSKLFIEDIVSKAKKVDASNKNDDGSIEIKISNNDIKNILDRKRLKKGLKENLIKDLNNSNIKAKTCETEAICVVIPKEKIEKKIIKYSDIK